MARIRRIAASPYLRWATERILARQSLIAEILLHLNYARQKEARRAEEKRDHLKTPENIG
jgi:hypothetical protein